MTMDYEACCDTCKETRQRDIARLVGALRGMLSHSCVADAGPDMKDAKDHAAETYAIRVLNDLDQR